MVQEGGQEGFYILILLNCNKIILKYLKFIKIQDHARNNNHLKQFLKKIEVL